MSKIRGFVVLVQRDGEDGKIGNIRRVYVLPDTSIYLINALKERGFYEGAVEEAQEWYASHNNADKVIGDFDGDGDYDEDDVRKARAVGIEATKRAKALDRAEEERENTLND